MKEIVISPATRLEGHAKISIFLNDEGSVEDAYFQVVELRGFEGFCRGRPAEELPRIVQRICGVCPTPHHMASGKAVDRLFGVEATPTAKKLRELSSAAHVLHSHIAHLYVLAAPDFIMGPDSAPAERNIVGVIKKLGAEAGKKIINARADAQKIQALVSGRGTHPINNLPGGIARGITEEQRADIERMSKNLVSFGEFTLATFESLVLKNAAYMDLITGDVYRLAMNCMGSADAENKVNFYEGDVRVVDPAGREFLKFSGEDYFKHIAEHVEPWSYMKFPYLRQNGWMGLVDGGSSGNYMVGPLARANASSGFATPKAQEAYEQMAKTLGKPTGQTLAIHWARAIEIMYAAERVSELVCDPEITSKDVRNIPTKVVGEGVGHVEAPRGTLFHHYWADKDGLTTKLNILVATGHNNAAICMSVKKAAEKLIHNFKVEEGLLNRVEMAFRAYDPCLSCATHALPGETPMEILIMDKEGRLLQTLRRGVE
jgi:F420-non-reducing hydrogenase large subunit